MLCMLKKKNIYPACISKHNSHRERLAIVLIAQYLRQARYHVNSLAGEIQRVKCKYLRADKK